MSVIDWILCILLLNSGILGWLFSKIYFFKDYIIDKDFDEKDELLDSLIESDEYMARLKSLCWTLEDNSSLVVLYGSLNIVFYLLTILYFTVNHFQTVPLFMTLICVILYLVALLGLFKLANRKFENKNILRYYSKTYECIPIRVYNIMKRLDYAAYVGYEPIIKEKDRIICLADGEEYMSFIHCSILGIITHIILLVSLIVLILQ